MTSKIDGAVAPSGNLENLKKQAKKLLKQAKERNPHAISRLARAKSLSKELQLSDAQTAIARENGCSTWTELREKLASPESKVDVAQTSIEINAIDQIWMDCTDTAKAQAFYCDVLNLRKTAEVPGSMVFFNCGGVDLLLGKSNEIRPNSILYFEMGDSEQSIQAAYNQLKDLGVRMGDSPHCIAENWNGYDVWIAFFFDPFGNQLAFKANVPVAG